MCFLKDFQEHNQTHKNIFQSIFWNATKYLKIFSFQKKYFHLKIFHSENIIHWAKHSLSCFIEFLMLLIIIYIIYNVWMLELSF